tara:strand:+ start:12409 stop:13656 length:1248 start_codon:yes stop_codon:yes gene_type:complete
MNKKNIVMLLDACFPTDVRVEKQAISLINSNLFNVYVICLRKLDEDSFEDYKGINVIRINSPALDQIVKKGIYDSFYSIRHFHNAFFNSLLKYHQKFSFDAIHVHDLPLAKTARIAAKKIKKPYVLDYHENYAEGLKIWFEWRTKIIIRLKNLIFFNYKKWSRFEKIESEKSNYIITVVEEMKQRLVNQYNLNENKLLVISNTENLDFHENTVNLELHKNLQNKFLITYIGGIGPHRGIDTAVEAMSEVKNIHKDALLLIIGGGSYEVINKLKSIIKRKNLSDVVVLFGKVDISEVSFYMRNSQLNIIPHHSNQHTNNTIPHKLFQILLSKQPLLVSNSSPLERIVKTHNAGYIHKASDPNSFAEKVSEVYLNYDQAKERAENGYQACLKKGLNWKKSGDDLINFYKKIIIDHKT